MQLTSRNGDRFSTYSAGAETAERAVLIIHDWWGLKPYNCDWADRLAKLGFRSLVIDLYDGKQPADPQEAGEFMRNIDQPSADAKMLAALEYLNQHHRRVAVLGWSFGGLQAQYASLIAPQQVAATVFFYSRVITDPKLLAPLEGPVLGIFSETERTWPEKQEQWIEAMSSNGKSYQYYSFNADHGFVNPESPRYDKAATETSWKLVADFLEQKL